MSEIGAVVCVVHDKGDACLPTGLGLSIGRLSFQPLSRKTNYRKGERDPREQAMEGGRYKRCTPSPDSRGKAAVAILLPKAETASIVVRISRRYLRLGAHCATWRRAYMNSVICLHRFIGHSVIGSFVDVAGCCPEVAGPERCSDCCSGLLTRGVDIFGVVVLANELSTAEDFASSRCLRP